MAAYYALIPTLMDSLVPTPSGLPSGGVSGRSCRGSPTVEKGAVPIKKGAGRAEVVCANVPLRPHCRCSPNSGITAFQTLRSLEPWVRLSLGSSHLSEAGSKLTGAEPARHVSSCSATAKADGPRDWTSSVQCEFASRVPAVGRGGERWIPQRARASRRAIGAGERFELKFRGGERAVVPVTARDTGAESSCHRSGRMCCDSFTAMGASGWLPRQGSSGKMAFGCPCAVSRRLGLRIGSAGR